MDSRLGSGIRETYVPSESSLKGLKTLSLSHGLRPFGISPERGGRSSIGIGHFFQTSNQFDLRLILRKTKVSSSGSNFASNWSPGLAGAKAVGMLNRRFASRITIMVELSPLERRSVNLPHPPSRSLPLDAGSLSSWHKLLLRSGSKTN